MLISKRLLKEQEFYIETLHDGDGSKSYYRIEAPNGTIFEAHRGLDFIYRITKPAHLVDDFTCTAAYAAAPNTQRLNDLVDMNKIKKIQEDDYNIFVITSIDKKTKVKLKIDNLVN